MLFRTDITPSTSIDPRDKMFVPPHLAEGRLKIAARLFQVAQPPIGCGVRSVLDVGCGIGSLYPLIRNPELTYEGIDPDPDFIRIAKKEHAGSGANFTVASVEQLGEKCRQEKYGIVFCLGVTPLLNPGADTLKKFLALLLAKARLCVILEFQEAGRYKGVFTPHTLGEVMAASGKGLMRVDTIEAHRQDWDSTAIVILKA